MARSSEARMPAPDAVLDIVRTFNAPRAVLFRVLADPEHRLRWWGPEENALSHCTVDLRVGGSWSVAMQGVDGNEHRVNGVFTEVEEPSRLCFTYVNEDDPYETLVTIDFVDLGAKTEMRFQQAPFPRKSARDGHSFGWNSSLELLGDYLNKIAFDDPKPFGPPRIDGVAADIAAARERYEREQGRKGANPPAVRVETR